MLQYCTVDHDLMDNLPASLEPQERWKMTDIRYKLIVPSFGVINDCDSFLRPLVYDSEEPAASYIVDALECNSPKIRIVAI